MPPADSPLKQEVLPLVDGKLVASSTDTVFQVNNPSNGRPLMSIPIGSDEDVNRAVWSCRQAFRLGSWCEASPSMKKQILSRFADAITANSGVFDALDASEMGKPVSEQAFNARSAASLLRFYAESIDKAYGSTYATDKLTFAAQRWVPRGVVAAVVPWNFPTYNAISKLAPALAAGNSVILKPSELASQSAVRLAQLATAAGIPSGAFNVVPGVGEIVGRALARHPDVDMVTFTGSTAVGKQMLKYAGDSNMKVVMAECGGKAPHIVFADITDLDGVAKTIASGLITNQGQVCSLGSRLLVERSIEERLVERIISYLQDIVIGDAQHALTTFGPLASQEQCDRVMQYIEMGKRGGARLVIGGGRALPESGGCFVEPTVFRDVNPAAKIAQEEIFGPVLSVIPFSTEAEAVEIANGTIYGLLAYVWTSDLSRALRLVNQLRSSLLVNTDTDSGEGAGFAFSSEPSGQSGVGVEGGLPGLQSYMRRQFVSFSYR